MRIINAQENLDYYRNLFTEKDVLNKITVTDEENVETIFENYNVIFTLERSLVPGGANVRISLKRSEE